MRCPCGGTVDADDSKSSAREGMGVRVSLGAFLASSRRSLGRFMKGAQAGKPCVSINPIWQTWQAKRGCGLDSVLACLSQRCKAQSTCQRQAVGGACRIHFRDQGREAFAPLRRGVFQHDPEFRFKRNRGRVSRQSEGTFDQMARHALPPRPYFVL